MKVAQWCLALCDPMDCTVYGILQARILEWVAVPFSRGSSQPRSLALQVDSLPAASPGKPKNRIKPGSAALQVDSLPAELSGKPIETERIELIQKQKEGNMEDLSKMFSKILKLVFAPKSDVSDYRSVDLKMHFFIASPHKIQYKLFQNTHYPEHIKITLLG